MPEYQILITTTAQRQLDKLEDKIASKLITTINALSSNPRPFGSKKLKGRPGFRIRKGDYRIIYDIHDRILIVEVIAIGNRRDIYD